MKTAFRFRLYPDRKQSKKMSRMIEAACRLWNDALAKSIHDAGWSQLVRFAEYKGPRAGKLVVRVPAAHSTQECSFCGDRNQVPLSVRQFECRGCGRTLDRDFNAAKIVLKRGLAQVGQGMPELKPVETGPLPVPTTVRASQAEEAGTIRMEQGLEAREFTRGRMSRFHLGSVRCLLKRWLPGHGRYPRRTARSTYWLEPVLRTSNRWAAGYTGPARKRTC